MTFDQLEQNQFPKIKNRIIIIFLFFPFNFWNKNIEYNGYKGLYGSEEFYTKFRNFWTKINGNIHNAFNDKIVHFVNRPLNVPICRDKEFTKAVLKDNGLPIPPAIFTRNPAEILKMTQQGQKLYLKVRYGSMGKGITRLQPEKWETNFRFEDNRITSKATDHGWTFIDITNNQPFLTELLTKDIIIEQSIDPHQINGQKFDLRTYVFFGRVLYIYARANKLSAVTTNISQGAQGMPPSFLKQLPNHSIKQTKKIAIKAARALGLNFAGIDVMIDQSGTPVLLELNAFAGFPATINPNPELNFPLSEKIVQIIEHQIQKGRWAT